MLNGQSLQGPPTAAEVNHMLKAKNMEERYVLSTEVLYREITPVAVQACRLFMRSSPVFHKLLPSSGLKVKVKVLSL